MATTPQQLEAVLSAAATVLARRQQQMLTSRNGRTTRQGSWCRGTSTGGT